MTDPLRIAVTGNGWIVLGPEGRPFLSAEEADALRPLARSCHFFVRAFPSGLEMLDLPGPDSPIPGSERRERGIGGGSAEASALGLPSGFTIEPLRTLLHDLSTEDARSSARALHLANWRRKMIFCPRCGARLIEHPSELALLCPSCALEEFPRISPAVIVLIERKGRILLAQNARFTGGMHSLVAGFVEAGETLEEAVSREVSEEIGLSISDLRYCGSQAWPFPDSLMLGFRASGDTVDIKPDGVEIIKAAWFDPTDLPPIPRKGSIARALIDGWLAERGFTIE